MNTIDFKKKIADIVVSNKLRPFMVLNYCNFIHALELLLKDYNLEINDMDKYQTKKIESKYLVTGTVFIVNLGIEIQMETFNDGKGNWFYSFVSEENQLNIDA